MKIRAYFVIALLAVLAAVSGCRTAPVYNVENAPVTTTTGNVTQEQVRDAILAAGVSLGWQMKEIGPGQIEGTLYLRDHVAQVDIPYDSNAYSILYKNSSNLRYDGATIHSNYNGWVQRLDRTIQARLVGM